MQEKLDNNISFGLFSHQILSFFKVFKNTIIFYIQEHYIVNYCVLLYKTNFFFENTVSYLYFIHFFSSWTQYHPLEFT